MLFWKKSWSNVRYAQGQKIEKHPGVPSGTLKVKRLKNIPERQGGLYKENCPGPGNIPS
jgi:hypothetical protein